MSKAFRKAAAGAIALALVAPASAGEPANTLAAMFVDLNRCIGSVPLEPGTDVTLQFSLNRRGGIIGKPRMTHARWAGDDAARKKSAAAIAEAFDRCLPLPITETLGGAIAGRPIAFRLHRPAAHEDKA
jgi:hypothetical protein